MPYPKQAQFFATGQRFRERGLFAGSQLGKTECAAFEMACHLTGEYPPDWPGRQFDKPVRAWAVGDSLKMVATSCSGSCAASQAIAESIGSGMIPKTRLSATRSRRAAKPTLMTPCRCAMRAVGFRRCGSEPTRPAKWRCRARPWTFVWLDEEPADFAIYSECLARVGATGGDADDHVHAVEGHERKFRSGIGRSSRPIALLCNSASMMCRRMGTSSRRTAPAFSPAMPSTNARRARAASRCWARARSTERRGRHCRGHHHAVVPDLLEMGLRHRSRHRSSRGPAC